MTPLGLALAPVQLDTQLLVHLLDGGGIAAHGLGGELGHQQDLAVAQVELDAAAVAERGLDGEPSAALMASRVRP